MPDFLRDPVRRYRLIAVLEAISWAALLLGMYLKYGPADTPVWVQVFGPIHGVLFIAYLASAFIVWSTLRWSNRMGVVALAAGIPPFGTVVFERWATARGHLATGTSVETPSPEPAA